MRALVAALIVALPSIAAAQPPPAGEVPPPPGDVPPPPGDVPPPPAGDVPPPPPGDVPPPPPQYDPAAAAATPPPPAAPVEVPPDAYRHDGLHLRMALGVGGGSVRRTVTNDLDDSERESRIAGGAFAMELTIGGTVGPVVLGGMIALCAGQGEASIELEDESEPVPLDGGFDTWLLAFVADWYPSVEGGFHVGGGLGLLFGVGKLPAGSTAVDLGIERVGGVGFGLSVSTGWDFWIGQQWSMGPLLRIAVGNLHGEGILDDGTRRVQVTEDDSFLSVSLQFTAVLH